MQVFPSDHPAIFSGPLDSARAKPGKPDALAKVEQQLIAVTNIAATSVDQKDFEARCMSAFQVKGQMKLLYAAA